MATKAKSKKTVKLPSTRGQKVYGSALKTEASKPQKERKAVLATRKGKAKPRRYHMSDHQAKEMRAGKDFNPFRTNGKYHAFVQALIVLGINKAHGFTAVKAEMKKILSKHTTCNNKDGWTAFANPKSKASKNQAKDLNGRILQNAQVLQRLTGQHPYGYKLAQLWACVDILADAKGMPKFRLNTQFKSMEQVKPVNELKKRGKAQAAKPKASKPKKKASKPKAKDVKFVKETDAPASVKQPAAA